MAELLKLEVHAGNHDRMFCPVTFKVNEEIFTDEKLFNNLYLVGQQGEIVPLQFNKENENYIFQFIIDNLPKNKSKVYTLEGARNGREATVSTTEIIEKENSMDINIGGEYFSSYVYNPSIAKPYLGPIMGPYGESYTRLDFETKEHPHHRSLWLAIGDVNGIDMWNEPKEQHGKQIHQEFLHKSSGPVCATIEAKNIWTNFREKPQIDETRKITIYNTPATGRFIDLDVTFTASYGKVEFGATKEAGPLGIRVAETMKVDSGGYMVNSYGSVGEEECWGQRSGWCDYYGEVGKHTLGIAVFDHPGNEHYPTYWHIRNYGLLAPNNFYFIGGKLIQPGEKLNYKYRVYFHDGDTRLGNVEGQYQNYINPPRIKIIK